MAKDAEPPIRNAAAIAPADSSRDLEQRKAAALAVLARRSAGPDTVEPSGTGEAASPAAAASPQPVNAPSPDPAGAPPLPLAQGVAAAAAAAPTPTMAPTVAPTGGRWVFSPPAGFAGLILGIDNGVAPVFPLPRPGALNVEVFTNASLSGAAAVPMPDAGFQSSMLNPGGAIDNGFLTGTDLRLGGGGFLAVDTQEAAAGESGSRIVLGSGDQTVVGTSFDTLVGGSGNQVLSAVVGNETVIGGTGNESIWGGADDMIIGGTGAQQIVLTGPRTIVFAGVSGNATIAGAPQDTITSQSLATQNIVIAGAANDVIGLNDNSGSDAVIGANGDTINAGAGTVAIDGGAGGMVIRAGDGGLTNVTGSSVAGAGDSITGGSGNLDFNPGPAAGHGDLIDLSGSSGNATINAFSFGASRVAAPDTILGSNAADSVFGGDGDRIGTANGQVVGGLHQWTHADTAAGSAVGFGSNDTIASTTYDSSGAIRGTVAGTSSAQVTIGGFNTATDYLFYQNESALMTTDIIATAQGTSVGGMPGVTLTLPDGTMMTLVGLTTGQLTPALFKP